MSCYRCITLGVIYVSMSVINVVLKRSYKVEYMRQKEKDKDKAKTNVQPLVPATMFISVMGNLTLLWHWTAATINIWQIENSLDLCQGLDVFITAKMGSRKSALTLTPVIAHHLRRNPHISIMVYPTEALTSDQVSKSFP